MVSGGIEPPSPGLQPGACSHFSFKTMCHRYPKLLRRRKVVTKFELNPFGPYLLFSASRYTNLFCRVRNVQPLHYPPDPTAYKRTVARGWESNPIFSLWWSRRESNPSHGPCKGLSPPWIMRPHENLTLKLTRGLGHIVDVEGFEPPNACV